MITGGRKVMPPCPDSGTVACRTAAPKPARHRSSGEPRTVSIGVSNLPDLAVPPSRYAILRAVPEGMRRARSQGDFKRAVKEHPDALALRSHGYTNLMRVVEQLADWADWTSLCTRPTEQRIADDTGLGKSTVERWVRWLRERAFLGVVEEGSTNATRPGNRGGLDDDGYGNRAAVWVLCTPAPDLDDTVLPQVSDLRKVESEDPSGSSRREEPERPTHTRERRSTLGDHSRISTTTRPAATPGTKRFALQQAQRLREESSVLRRMSSWYVRHLARVFLVAGWTVSDVLHALDHLPDGTAWTYTWKSMDELRHIPGWVRHRLNAWLGEDGQVLASRSQQMASAAERQRAEQEQFARQREEARARRAGGPGLAPAPKLSRAEALAPPPEPTAPSMAPAGQNPAVQALREQMRARQEKLEAERLMYVTNYRRQG